MLTPGWRLYNIYLITGAILFFALAYFGPRPPEPEYWQEFAHYDPSLVPDGVIIGSVRYESAAACTNKAREKYFYEYKDVVGSIPAPANGIDSPFIWGCQRVTLDGLRLPEIRR